MYQPATLQAKYVDISTGRFIWRFLIRYVLFLRLLEEVEPDEISTAVCEVGDLSVASEEDYIAALSVALGRGGGGFSSLL